jgi:tRNA pseudouridine55 synthase
MIEDLSAEDFLNGQFLLIDKPLEWTSFDAVKKIRYLIKKKFKLRKIKVGHAGTLDPLATGLLIICTGKFTKKIAELTLEDKTYTGTIQLGATTPSYDLETQPENFKSTDHLSSEAVQRAAEEMTGNSLQVPPAFSAKWVDGKRAYESAREGREVELKANPVKIHQFSVNCEHLPEVQFEIKCSKGTYIRSIAHDLGDKLEVGGYLSSLRRTHIGRFSVEDAMEINTFENKLHGS